MNSETKEIILGFVVEFVALCLFSALLAGLILLGGLSD